MNIKNKKLYFAISLLSTLATGSFVKSNAVNIGIQGDVVGSWIISCKLKNHSRFVGEVVFNANGKFDNDSSITLLEYDEISKYKFIGRARHKSNGIYKHEEDKLTLNHTNIIPKPQNNFLPTTESFKLKWTSAHSFRMESIEEAKNTYCEAKREYSSIKR